jgi:hypothetical protein
MQWKDIPEWEWTKINQAVYFTWGTIFYYYIKFDLVVDWLPLL